MRSNTFKGTYRTRRDSGREYSYDGSWELQANLVSWSARVRCGHDGPWVMDGTINVTAEADYTAAVRHYVEGNIEHRVGID